MASFIKELEILKKEKVPFFPLSDLVIFLKNERLLKKYLLPKSERSYPVVGGGENLFGYYSSYNNEGNAVTVARYGSSGFINYISERFYATDNSIPFQSKDENQVITKYLYYYLKENEKEIKKLVLKTAIPILKKSSLSQFPIPLPSLKVQKEIVSYLDPFTKLTQELTQELEFRRKQYAYYLKKLIYENEKIIKKVPLSEVSFYVKERIPFHKLTPETHISCDNLLPERQGRKNSEFLPKKGTCVFYKENDIIIGNIRPYLKKIWFSSNSGGAGSSVIVLRAKNINPLFLYFVLSSDIFFNYDYNNRKGSTFPVGDKKKIMNFLIPILPLEEQNKIVNFLKKMEKLTFFLKTGIPYEIELNKKRYRYYRNLLLKF